MAGTVTAVSCSGEHTMRKAASGAIRLLAGLGIDGDAHLGVTVQHRSRRAKDPTRPNLRQVHLIHAELHDELAEAGFALVPGEMGENVTTRGIDLLALPTGARLRLGADAVCRSHGAAQPVRSARWAAPRLDGGRPRSRRRWQPRPQGWYYGCRTSGGRRTARRSDHRRISGRRAQPTRSSLGRLWSRGCRGIRGGA